MIEAELERERGRHIDQIKLVDEHVRVQKLEYAARSGARIERERER